MVGLNCLLLMDFGIRLYPFPFVLVGNFVVLPASECRHRVHAYHAVVGVILGVDHHSKINAYRATLNGDCRRAIFFGKRFLERLQHLQWVLVAEVFLFATKHAEDIHVLEGLSLGVSLVRPREEIIIDSEPVPYVFTDLVVASRCILLFVLVQLQSALEFSECVINGQHDLGLLSVVTRPSAKAVVLNGSSETLLDHSGTDTPRG